MDARENLMKVLKKEISGVASPEAVEAWERLQETRKLVSTPEGVEEWAKKLAADLVAADRGG